MSSQAVDMEFALPSDRSKFAEVAAKRRAWLRDTRLRLHGISLDASWLVSRCSIKQVRTSQSLEA